MEREGSGETKVIAVRACDAMLGRYHLGEANVAAFSLEALCPNDRTAIHDVVEPLAQAGARPCIERLALGPGVERRVARYAKLGDGTMRI